MASLGESIFLKEGSFRKIKVKLKYKNRMVNALLKTDIKLTIRATFSALVAKRAKKAPII